jgi:K+-sensing histidine kinase KdpD
MNSPYDYRLLKNKLQNPIFNSGLTQYLLSVFIVISSSVICFVFAKYIGYQSVSYILLFVVSILAIFLGIGPILLAATLSALIWNFFFIPPKFTIHIETTEDTLMFGLFFIIALVNGVLTSRVRRQEKLTREREERTNALYSLTREITNAEGIKSLIEVARKNIRKQFCFEPVFVLQDGNNYLSEYSADPSLNILSENDLRIAEWSFANSDRAGKFTKTLTASNFTFYPLSGNIIKPGVMAIKHFEQLAGDKKEFWDTFVSQISNAIEKEFLDDIARKAQFLADSDKLFKTLFTSISHELRIPVATIIGATDSLLSSHHSDAIRKELTHEISKASLRLNRLIENLLNMSRLESGRITPRLDWCDMHDLINKVCENLFDELRVFHLQVAIQDDMPLVKIDFGLMEQVLYNLIYNATQYAPHETNIRIKVFYENKMMTVHVMDRGPGFSSKEMSLIFNKFYRVEGSKAGGTGLGLSIAKGFVEAHKGNITVENRQNGGAKFIINIPTDLPLMEIKG